MTRYTPADSTLSPRFSGVPTFARLPLMPAPEERPDAVVLGVPFDTGASFRVGSRFGPNAVRAGSLQLRSYNSDLQVDTFRMLSCVDGGDVAVVPGYLERSHAAIEQHVASIVAAGAVPVLLGGDHSITLAHLRACRALGPVGLVVFDAHTDAWDSFFGEPYNHGTWLRRAVEEQLVNPARSIHVGVRGQQFDAADWDTLRGLRLELVTMADVRRDGVESVAEQIRARVGEGPTFVTFDLDSVDPAFAPGTGTPEVAGLSSSDALTLVRGLASLDLVGCDVVELLPTHDPAGVTALLAATIAYELLSLVALRALRMGDDS